MFSAPDDEYDHQYYEDGLNFDHDYNREAQVVKDHARPLVTVHKDSILFVFPQIIKGQVKLMRPASDAKDTTFALDNSNGRDIRLATAQLAKGKWQLVFDWKSGHKSYLYHQEVYIK